MGWFTNLADKVQGAVDKVEEKLGGDILPERDPAAAIDISGRWLSPWPIILSQEGDNVSADEGGLMGEFTAEVHEYTITAFIGGIKQVGTINRKGDQIGWKNGASWCRYPNAIQSGMEVFLKSGAHDTFVTGPQHEALSDDAKLIIVKDEAPEGEELLTGDKIRITSSGTGESLGVDRETGQLMWGAEGDDCLFRIENDDSVDGVFQHDDLVNLRCLGTRSFMQAYSGGNMTAEAKEVNEWERFELGRWDHSSDEFDLATKPHILSARQQNMLVDRANKSIDIILLSEEKEHRLLHYAVTEMNTHMKESLLGFSTKLWVDLFEALLDDMDSIRNKKRRVHAVLTQTMREPLTETLNQRIDMPILGEEQEVKVIRKMVDYILKMISNFAIEGLEKSGFT